jgi:hypothetical protein
MKGGLRGDERAEMNILPIFSQLKGLLVVFDLVGKLNLVILHQIPRKLQTLRVDEGNVLLATGLDPQYEVGVVARVADQKANAVPLALIAEEVEVLVS